MSAPEQFYDLHFKQLCDRTIRLEQKDYGGESYIIDLHPCQLRHIAERAGLLSPAPAEWPRGFKQRLVRLQASIDYLSDDCWQGEIVKRLGEGLAYRAGMYAALDTINDLLLDAGIVPDEGASNPAPKPLDASPLPECLPSITEAAGGPSEPSLFD